MLLKRRTSGHRNHAYGAPRLPADGSALALLLRHPIPTLAPMLLQQPDIGHGHAAVHGFAHVVDGEEADLNGGEEVKQINNLALCELQR